MKYQTETTDKVTETIKQAGIILKDLYYKSVEIEEKSPKDYVTSADITIDNFLKEQLPKIIPGLGIYSEEQNSTSIQENQWVIDPIDGTTNFILGIPHFAISIASNACILFE